VAALTSDRRDWLAVWKMTVSRDGPLVLGHPIEGGFHEMTPPLGAPRRGTAYDDCLLENLRGVASDVAATAIISACRTRHPADARYDVTVEVRQGGSPALLLALNASEVREVVALIARVLAGLEPEIETAAERIVADRLRGAEDDLQVAVASARAVEAKRLEKGRFVWPQAQSGVVSLTAAQLSMLVEGIDWRMPAWTARLAATVCRDRSAAGAAGGA